MKSWLNNVLSKVIRWWNEDDCFGENEFPSFISKARFLYGGRG